MKKNKIIDAIGLADERYIAEAAPSKKRSRTVEVSNPFRGERDQREHTAKRCWNAVPYHYYVHIVGTEIIRPPRSFGRIR
jgi:hypothetical protein